jgi:hypothetical protein
VAKKKKNTDLTAKSDDLNITNPESGPITIYDITEEDIRKEFEKTMINAYTALDQDINVDLFGNGEIGKRLKILTFIHLMNYLDVYPSREDGKLVGLGTFEDTMEFIDYHKLILPFVYKDFFEKARAALMSVVFETVREFYENLERLIRDNPGELESLSRISLACHRYRLDMDRDRT